MGAVLGVCPGSYRECLAKAPAPSRLFIVPFRQFSEPVPLLAYFGDLEQKLPAAWLQGALWKGLLEILGFPSLWEAICYPW